LMNSIKTPVGPPPGGQHTNKFSGEKIKKLI
jgi:hypothetical protein